MRVQWVVGRFATALLVLDVSAASGQAGGGRGTATVVSANQQIGAARQGPPARGPGRRGGAAAAGRGAAAAQLIRERLVRQQLAQVVRKRLGLNDDQMARLGAIDSSFSEQRVRADNLERMVRAKLQQAMLDTNRDQAAQLAIGQYVDRMVMNIPQQRLNVDKAEQRALAEVLTPAQRAQFVSIRERVRVVVDSVAASAPPLAAPAKAGRRGGGR